MTTHALQPARRLLHSLALGLLLAGAGPALAADYPTLSNRYGNHNVLGKEPAVRIGKAAMVRVLTHRPASKELAASHYLLACDGSWMTDNFAYASMASNTADFAAIERHSIANLPEVIEAEHHFAMQETDPSYDGPVLRTHVKRLCAEARPAPPDMLVPVGSSREFTDMLLVFSMAAKPVQVKGKRVQAWFRTTFYTQKDTVGRQPDPAVPTGEYWMTLKEVDCAKPQFRELEKIVHSASGTQRGACPAKGAGCPMIPLKEYSMGDAERKMACRLFGKSAAPLPL